MLEGDCCCSLCCCCCCSCMLHVGKRRADEAAKLSAALRNRNRLIRLSYLRTICRCCCRCCCSGINALLPCWPQDANNSQAKPSRSESKRSALAPSLASGLGPRDFNLTPFGGILRLPLCSIVEAFYMASDRHNRQQDERQDPERDNRRQPHTFTHQQTHVLHVSTEVNNRSKY